MKGSSDTEKNKKRMKTMYVVKFACDGKQLGIYETKSEAQIAIINKVDEAPGKRFIFDFTMEERKMSWKDIKTFDDACAALGYAENKMIKDYYYALTITSEETEEAFAERCGADVLAYMKLRIIRAAINEGWEPKFTEDEDRWYPWFFLYDKEEYNSFSEEEKQRCVVCACSVAVAKCGFADSDALVGTHLTFESKEKAEHAGVHFKELWADFCFREAEKK